MEIRRVVFTLSPMQAECSYEQALEHLRFIDAVLVPMTEALQFAVQEYGRLNLSIDSSSDVYEPEEGSNE